MKVLILNSILYTADNRVIPQVDSIKDCMIYSLGLAFRELGHEVTLVAASDYRPRMQETYDFEVVFLNSKWKRVFLPTVFPFQPNLWSFLKKHSEYDMILTSEVFAIPSLFAAMIAPRRTIVWQELNAHNKLFKKIPSKIWYNLIARLFFRKIPIAPRSEEAYRFIRHYCRNAQPTIVDHGVNLDKFTVAEKKKKQFIIVSQLIKRKNVDYMIRQFADFIRQDGCSDYRLLIAGKGIEENRLKQLVRELNIQENVAFLGFLDHKTLNQHVAESVAMLIHTQQDLNMVSIPESIVSGTPIITNSVPLLAGYIRENQLGIVQDSWTYETLNQAVELQTQLSQNCTDKRTELSSVNSARKLIKLFLANH